MALAQPVRNRVEDATRSVRLLPLALPVRRIQHHRHPLAVRGLFPVRPPLAIGRNPLKDRRLLLKNRGLLLKTIDQAAEHIDEHTAANEGLGPLRCGGRIGLGSRSRVRG